MKEFHTKLIGEDLFEVYIDGVKQPIPYTLTQLGELYAAKWEEGNADDRVHTS